ncbi:MAG TPA: PEP-CTERM sorting domain-containing protein [Stellaceae bacterium]|nr:PEP-CTERM sorting domain-containing protein [Stellaceae bacterium]
MAAVAALTVAMALPARASLITENYKNAGDGLLTVDTTTGQQWLNVPVTLGLSPAAALAANPGFHLATAAEVESLFVDAGIPVAHFNQNTVFAGDLAAGNLLVQLLGYSVFNFGLIYDTFGNLLNPSGLGWDQLDMEVRNPPAGFPGTSTDLVGLGPDGNDFRDSVSINFDYLVRDAPVSVPEPAALLLLGSGLLGALYFRRRAAA